MSNACLTPSQLRHIQEARPANPVSLEQAAQVLDVFMDYVLSFQNTGLSAHTILEIWQAMPAPPAPPCGGDRAGKI
ncbi:MAG: hypothetical protein WAX89_03335 [Alphaproteobacteria bacterium]